MSVLLAMRGKALPSESLRVPPARAVATAFAAAAVTTNPSSLGPPSSRASPASTSGTPAPRTPAPAPPRAPKPNRACRLRRSAAASRWIISLSKKSTRTARSRSEEFFCCFSSRKVVSASSSFKTRDTACDSELVETGSRHVSPSPKTSVPNIARRASSRKPNHRPLSHASAASESVGPFARSSRSAEPPSNFELTCNRVTPCRSFSQSKETTSSVCVG
mmetsp:Transcript_10856/g.40193  ORF Transcript_10856/g.40193 Transcript_10856/m.40193 type:complete len:219 (-) Transcript_10856:5198-5854(-)